MGKYLITGSPGAGKSTVAKALKQRGFVGYDSESMPGITRLEVAATGKPSKWPLSPVDWKKYAFNWQEKGLRRLLDSSPEVFVAASVSNQEKFYHLFDRIFVLTVDQTTLKHRLLTRRKLFGKRPDELAGIINHHTEREAGFLAQPQSVAINASQSLEKVVDDIIAYVQNHHR
jgi:broad-specificity NMP kinase